MNDKFTNHMKFACYCCCCCCCCGGGGGGGGGGGVWGCCCRKRKKLCDICSMTPVTFVFFNINQELPQSFGGYTFSFEVSSAAESKH